MPRQHENLLSRVVRALKTHRFALPWVLLRKSLAKLVRTETLIIYHHDLKAGAFGGPPSAPSVVVIHVEGADSPLFSALCARYPHGNFTQRLQVEGRLCFVALNNDEIAGYAWVAVSSLYIDEIARTYPVAPDEIFIYDCFVENRFRGKGIYPAMLGAVLRDNSARNGKREKARIGASAVNQASIRGILKAGFVELKRIRYIECCRRQRWWGLATPASTQVAK